MRDFYHSRSYYCAESMRKMSRREVGGGRKGRGGEVKCFAVEEEREKTCVCDEQSTLHGMVCPD